MKLLNDLFTFILLMSTKYKIDESHDISHSMNVLHFVNDIYDKQVYVFPPLKKYERVIFVSALLHDMCDKKYMNETKGMDEICNYLKPRITSEEVEMVKNIVTTMSYSKVKQNGFPKLGYYMWAYHVVREADLFAAYDFDRCMIYHIKNNNGDIETSFKAAETLFQDRVLKHHDDGLLLTEYSKENYIQYNNIAIQRINSWKKILKKPVFN